VSEYVLSPIELEQFSIDGIERMLKTIFGIQQRANKGLKFLGMIPNRFDPRSTRQKETLRALIENYSQYLIPEPIGIRTSIPEALSEGIPVWKLGKTSARDAGKQIKAAFGVVYQKMGVNHG
jgi:chromosome partitioning protein